MIFFVFLNVVLREVYRAEHVLENGYKMKRDNVKNREVCAAVHAGA